MRRGRDGLAYGGTPSRQAQTESPSVRRPSCSASRWAGFGNWSTPGSCRPGFTFQWSASDAPTSTPIWPPHRAAYASDSRVASAFYGAPGGMCISPSDLRPARHFKGHGHRLGMLHIPREVQSVAQALSVGVRTRAGSMANPRDWAYSKNPALNLGATGSAACTIGFMLSGIRTLNTPPKKPQAASQPATTSPRR